MLKRRSRLSAPNIAPADFVVNYSDVNCIVNKASTFLSFPTPLMKCVRVAGRRE